MAGTVILQVTAELTVAQWFLSPGKTLHTSWWHKLGLSTWMALYQSTPSLARHIDLYIRHAMNMPELIVTPSSFSDIQKSMFTSVKRLPKLIVALGLLLLECPDYLLRREYRQQLETVLDEMSINQLWMLWRGQKREPNINAQDLIDAAWDCGYYSLAELQKNDPLWCALRLQLPAPKELSQDKLTPATEVVWSEFRRLERFL